MTLIKLFGDFYIFIFKLLFPFNLVHSEFAILKKYHKSAKTKSFSYFYYYKLNKIDCTTKVL